MDFTSLLGSLLPTLGSAIGSIGGPVGTAVGGALGGIAGDALGQLDSSESQDPSVRREPSPQAPLSEVTGVRQSPPRPELSSVNPLADPGASVFGEAGNPGGMGANQQDPNMDRRQRMEMLRELLGDMNNA